jgi:hypothetical protein
MPIQVGYIDIGGYPRITLDIWGSDAVNIIQVDALIDTGFSDFLMLPSDQAVSSGIVQSSTANYILADGSIVTNSLGNRSLAVHDPTNPPASGLAATHNPAFRQPEVVDGTVVLCGDCALVGMEFIRSLNKYLVVGKELVALIDEIDLDALGIV